MPRVLHAEGGRDPLDEVRVYAHSSGHWHYVTFGLSELGSQPSPDAGRSGWGFELTFRLRRHRDAETAPLWPVGCLQDLARYVFESRNPLDANHHISLDGPFDPEAPRFVAVALAVDPDLGRASILDDRELGRVLRARAAQEGSSQSVAFAATLEWIRSTWPWRRLAISLGDSPAVIRSSLSLMLDGRIQHGRQFRIVRGPRHLLFRPAERAAWLVRGQEAVVDVDAALAAELHEFLTGGGERFTSAAARGLSLRLRE